jgi:hypothetical protein
MENSTTRKLADSRKHNGRVSHNTRAAHAFMTMDVGARTHYVGHSMIDRRELWITTDLVQYTLANSTHMRK